MGAMARKKSRASGEDGRPLMQPVILCAWRRTGWDGSGWLPDVFVNGSPVALQRIAASLVKFVPTGRGDLALSCMHPGLAENQAIFDATDHRTRKSEKRKRQLSAPDELFRQGGARVQWLSGLDLKYSRTEENPGVQLRGERAFVRLDEPALADLVKACGGQAEGWGNHGAFGRFTASGLVFAPDWLGVE
jgi:hypothetical protein